MSICRRILIVLLLALSLPVQSFAAVSSQYTTAPVHRTEMGMPHAEHGASARHMHVGHETMLARSDNERHCGNAHQTHTCSTCASCCLGIALPSAPAVDVCAAISRAIVPPPSSVGVVSFLTDGIERPPRHLSV
ncbi:hypothetical protein CIW54_02845 [Paraburkholderia sp. T12-10]|nr:hypothetical protein CIW54_02845 [Paraburkholderia sp. T12-10]